MTPRRNQQVNECIAGVGHERPKLYGFCQGCWNNLPADIRERVKLAHMEGPEEIDAALASALNEL